MKRRSSRLLLFRAEVHDMYKVIAAFEDLQDGGYHYNEGDNYPRKGGAKPSKERIAELSGSDNKRGIPLIEKK
jgi:hypothetical protein